MPSMTYCMFENTELELSQVVGFMEEADSFDELDLNQYEKAAFLRMHTLCRVFLAEHARLLESMNDE